MIGAPLVWKDEYSDIFPLIPLIDLYIQGVDRERPKSYKIRRKSSKTGDHVYSDRNEKDAEIRYDCPTFDVEVEM